MWIGEYQIGDRLPLNLWVRSGVAPTLPDDPVRAIIYAGSGSAVETFLLPIADSDNETAYFHTDTNLDGKYSTGEHTILYLYEHSSTMHAELQRFNILAGGDPNGTGMAIEYFSVSPNRYLLVQNHNGTLIRRKSPAIS